MAELVDRYGAENIDSKLIVGESGAFEVVVEGEKIFSKKETGAFPRYGEIPLAIDMKAVGR